MTELILAVDDKVVGLGNTPEEAFEELKRNADYSVEFEDVKFFQGIEVKVKTEYIIVKEC